jgi:hypothetical protein
MFGCSHTQVVAAAQLQGQLQQLCRGFWCAPGSHVTCGLVQRRHRLAGASCGGKVTRSFFWIDDDRAHLSMHRASV